MDKYFEILYKEAYKAFKTGEIPVSAIIVKENKVISKAHNNRQKKHNILGHAEINAIIKAEKKLKDWRLDGCIMYVTLQPCELCERIILDSRIDNVYYLLKSYNGSKKMNKNVFLQTNVCNTFDKKYKILFKSFFKKLRK